MLPELNINTNSGENKPRIILFDVYETLLDMQFIRRRINTKFDSRKAYAFWLSTLVQYSMVSNSIANYYSFSSIASAALKMVGKTYGHNISESESDSIVELFSHSPVYDNVSRCLSKLVNSGYELSVLTNASKDIISERMERTGLISYFNQIISAEEVKKYKPATEVYNWAVKRLNASAEDINYVSAHSWDIIGAASAHLNTIYLAHHEPLYFPLAKQPRYSFPDFEAFVESFTKNEKQ